MGAGDGLGNPSALDLEKMSTIRFAPFNGHGPMPVKMGSEEEPRCAHPTPIGREDQEIFTNSLKTTNPEKAREPPESGVFHK